jgi:hypothetical protein
MHGFLAEHLGVFDPDDIRILTAASIRHGRPFRRAERSSTRLKPTPRGRYSQNTLLPLPGPENLTKAGYATALYWCRSRKFHPRGFAR